MRIDRLLLVVALMVAGRCAAQEVAEVDSLLVVGRVVELQGEKPIPFCRVQFVQEEMVRASVMTDVDGLFAVEGIAEGDYLLKVAVSGVSVYQDSVGLSQDVRMTVKINMDTVRLISLPAVDVTSSRIKNRLEGMGLLITSPGDRRLWNFSGKMTESFPASVGGLCY